MAVSRVQKRINCPFLNPVRWTPVKPVKAVMLGHDDIDRAHEFGQKHQQPFFDQTFSAISFLIHHVAVFKSKLRINLQIDFQDSGFLAQFSQRTLQFGFPFILCARLNKKEAILATFPQRLAQTRAAEITTALEEIAKIARLRLEDVIG